MNNQIIKLDFYLKDDIWFLHNGQIYSTKYDKYLKSNNTKFSFYLSILLDYLIKNTKELKKKINKFQSIDDFKLSDLYLEILVNTVQILLIKLNFIF